MTGETAAAARAARAAPGTAAATRPVITGIGVVAPTGMGNEAHWRATLQGARRIGPIGSFDAGGYPCRVAGAVRDFDPDLVDTRLRVQTDRWTWMALAATDLALRDAGLDLTTLDPYEVAVILASSTGGNEFGQREIEKLYTGGPRAVSAYQSIAWFYAASTGQISIRHGLKGPCGVVVTEGAGGLDSLAHTARTIRRGASTVIAGGTDAPIAPFVLTSQLRGGRLTTHSDPGAYRPFDTRASGHVPGEGGAILIVEHPAGAGDRGARAYAEIAGHASTHDAHHHAHGAPDGAGLARAMTLALERAAVSPSEVDVVFADAAGTPTDDRAEALAIHAALGDHANEVLVTAPKAAVGRLYSGGAALDAATAALAIRDGQVPPTPGLETPDPAYGLTFVTEAPVSREIRTVVINARGFGGFNSSVVLRRPAHQP